MASPELAIAKAALSASLFRADPTSLSRPSADAGFQLVSSAVAQCSRPNVQKCRAWIVDNVAVSAGRNAALAKFVLALSRSFSDDGQRPSVKRRRLHVLYLLNDVLYHVTIKQGERSFASAWDAVAPGLVASAASFDKCPKHIKKLQDLVGLWEEKGYFSPSLVSQLRDAITSGTSDAPATEPQTTSGSIKLAKDAPYILPSLHGDPSTPWYDQPASTWLPHLAPNSTKPMLPDLIRPIQLAPGPADKALATAVETLLSDADYLFSKKSKADQDANADLNELGERVIVDEITGEIIGGETYYGWSRPFCEKMKQRRTKATGGSDRGRSPSTSSSYSRGRSRSSSAPAFKRRRLSSGSRSRSRSPRRSRTRTRSPDRRYDRSPHRRSFTPSRSRSRSNSRRRPYRRSPSPPSHHQRPYSSQQQQPRPPNPHLPGHSAYPPIPPPGEFPVPPPPPAGYQGPWPPPPPPLPPQHMGAMPPQNWPGAMPPHMVGGWGSAAPPPPRPQQGHYGRGNGNGSYRGRGRGGYDRGRGGW